MLKVTTTLDLCVWLSSLLSRWTLLIASDGFLRGQTAGEKAGKGYLMEPIVWLQELKGAAVSTLLQITPDLKK